MDDGRLVAKGRLVTKALWSLRPSGYKGRLVTNAVWLQYCLVTKTVLVNQFSSSLCNLVVQNVCLRARLPTSFVQNFGRLFG